VGGVAIEDRGVSGADLARVVEDDDLGSERGGLVGWRVLAVRGDEASADVLDGDIFNVEADVVAWHSLGQRLVVHLDGLDLSGDHGGRECDDHAWLDDAGLDTTDWDCADTADLVHVLERQSQGPVGWARGRVDGVEGLEESEAGGLASLLGLLVPALEPGHVGGLLDHVVSGPS